MNVTIAVFDNTTGLPKSGVNVKYSRDGGSTFTVASTTNAKGVVTNAITGTGEFTAYFDSSPSGDYTDLAFVFVSGKDIVIDEGNILAHSKSGSDTNFAGGTLVLDSITSGTSNVSIGITSMFNLTTGSNNSGVGRNALNALVGGASNTALGFEALRRLQSGADNTASINCSGLGNGTRVSADNQVQLGDSATTTFVYGTVQNRSDERDKADIEDSDLGLDFINKLRPVSYKWDMREDYEEVIEVEKSIPNPTFDKKQKVSDSNKKTLTYKDTEIVKLEKDGSKKRKRKHYGVIAQEIKELLSNEKIDFGGFQDHSLGGGSDVMSIGYDEFIAPLIKAVQELSAKVKTLEEK